MFRLTCCFFFFFIATATSEIYTLSLHDALPILLRIGRRTVIGLGKLVDERQRQGQRGTVGVDRLHDEVLALLHVGDHRSEEHTSELQSRRDLVCRLLLEKKKKNNNNYNK